MARRMYYYSIVLLAAVAAGGVRTWPPLPPPPPRAARLAFLSWPGSAVAGQVMAPVRVQVLDDRGRSLPEASNWVRLTLSPRVRGSLRGTTLVSAWRGVATFSDIRIETAGPGYFLQAWSPGLSGAASGCFTVRALKVQHLPYQR